jgi:perosamine synthetase
MSALRPIHHTFAPLGDSRQCAQTLGLLLSPWRWRSGKANQDLAAQLAERFQGDAFLFASGREALLAILRSLVLTPGEEIIIQGYTCVVVPNAITAAGCVPVYADIDRDSLNLNVEEVEKAITPKTRAVICQHTFGIPAQTEVLRSLCDKHSLFLIEDCAHIMPDKKGPYAITRLGDALFFSFGRDKAISGITGGAVLSRDQELSTMLKREAEKAGSLSPLEIGALLLYPLVYALGRPFYAMKIGKVFLALCGRLGLLRPLATKQEKAGTMTPRLRMLPNAFASLALAQLNRLEEINAHRRMLTAYYLQQGLARGWFRPDPATGESALPLDVGHDLPLQKFPLFLRGAESLRRKLKAWNIHLHDGWTACVICPPGTALEAAQYVPGTDPEAEEACERIFSLPTHPGTSLRDAAFLVEKLDSILKKIAARSQHS